MLNHYFKPVINSKEQIQVTFNQQVEEMIEALGDFEDGSTCEVLVEGKQDRIKRDSYTHVSDITQENEQVIIEIQNKKETSYYYGIDRSGKTEEILNKVSEEQYLYNGSSDVVQLVQGSRINYYEYDDSGRSSLLEGYGYRSEYQESGYQYLRFRYLDLDSGRFMSKDSYLGNEDPVSQNRYTYVGNNPINYSDPSGHKANPFKTMPGIPGAIKPIQKIAVDIAKEEEEQIEEEIAHNVELMEAIAKESNGGKTGAPQQLIERLLWATIQDATPEEKIAIIRAYCKENNLDEKIEAALIEELTNKTYDNLVANTYNSKRAEESRDGITWSKETGPFI